MQDGHKGAKLSRKPGGHSAFILQGERLRRIVVLETEGVRSSSETPGDDAHAAMDASRWACASAVLGTRRSVETARLAWARQRKACLNGCGAEM